MDDTTGIREAFLGLIRVLFVTTTDMRIFYEFAKGEHTEIEGINTKSIHEFWGRTGVRMLFANMEAIIYNMKLVAVKVQGHQGVAFTVGEMLLLYEQSYSMRENGNVIMKEGGAKTEFRANLKFAVSAFARALRSEHVVDYGGAGWARLDRAVTLRDRLTHPKTASQFMIEVNEFEDAQAGYDWFLEQVNLIIDNSDWSRIKAALNAQES